MSARRPFDHDSNVHRPIRLNDRGDDARTMWRAINRRLRDLGRRTRIGTRGPMNRRKLRVALEVLHDLGVNVKHRGLLTRRAQEVLRDPGKRTRAQKRRADKRAGSRVRRPKQQVVRNVRNQSARSGPIRLIVLHDTEGANIRGVSDLVGLGDWFDNPGAQASSHIAVDAEGNTGRYVPDDRKAWHSASFNSMSLGIEQVGFASQKDWPEAQLRKVAKWIAYWHKEYGIPIRHSTSHGVCRHSDLGVAGGGHHDPGPAYDLGRVLKMAREYAENGW